MSISTNPLKTFDETARLSGSSGEEVSSWIRRLESLGVDKLETISAVENGIDFNFIQIGFFPETDTYGFAFAPPNDLTAQKELQNWARLSHPPRHRMDALDGEWFYYEGHWPGRVFLLRECNKLCCLSTIAT